MNVTGGEARPRKRSGHHTEQTQPSEEQNSGSGLAPALGALPGTVSGCPVSFALSRA
ncbi:hypothetical protein AB0E85_37045 [Streptomyces sp. NPDC029044]|uniref:hypothetical protein n=1 Tax=Streptomyces sp. NPDC029044 TaxID=3157198 RepID=UPI003408F036